jgi:acyl-CoA synthetase (NDP forming)
MDGIQSLRRLFDAQSVAVVGASNTPGKWGFGILSLLLQKGGRQVYAVNRKGGSVLGVRAYRSLREIPEPVDLAVLVTAAPDTPAAMEDCVSRGVRAAVVISGGFAETGEDGARLERRVVEVARRGGIRFIGPNCMGHFDTFSVLFTMPFKMPVRQGPVSMVTQSGNSGVGVLTMGWETGLGFAKYLNSGNEADIHFEDFLEYLGQDEDTSVIIGYIEGLREGRRFLKLASEISRQKPMVVLKGGRTSEGSRAARSHSAALSGSDEVSRAAFRQAGLIQVEELSDLVDTALALASQPLPRGRRIGLISMGGGLGVISTDALKKRGLEMARFSSRTMDRLNSILSDRWSRGNPVDPGGDPIIYPCIWPVIEDENVDAVMVVGRVGMAGGLAGIMPVPDMLKADYDRLMVDAEEKELADLDRLLEMRKRYGKPVVVTRMLSGSITEGRVSSKLRDDHLYPYPSPERAARSLARLVEYSEYLGMARSSQAAKLKKRPR